MADAISTPASSGSASPPATAAPAATASGALKLQVSDLHVTYRGRGGDDVEAVRGVSFDIPDKPGKGEIVVFLGPSGCGKSTILKTVAGLLPPTRGQVLIEGHPVTGPGADRGMVFQQYTSFGWLTVQENVEYGLRLRGVPKEERRAQAHKILERVGLLQFARSYPKELSGGMKQRVAIARTLINRPALLLMDEPFGALDPQTRWEMQGMLIDISHREDNTILFVTHDVSEAVYLADTVYVLSRRPARILHRMDIPGFEERSLSLKASPQFREAEERLLQLLYAPTVTPVKDQTPPAPTTSATGK
ncbi:MAG: ABC transporter ATP-binding protein [Myxococcales bacterium]|nr:ABC transporter ATP-binding protein [Myxococcales bacterium]